MNRSCKRILATVLTWALLLGIMPRMVLLPVRAEGTETVTNPLAGKTISILGASISTFAGISNGAAADSTNSTIRNNAEYYPHSVVTDVKLTDTWWMQVAEDLDLRLLVNNSWSGSSLLYERNGTVGAYVDRCVQLHDDTGDNAGEVPDIIGIQMGTNDFQYYKDTLGTADIDYEALITENGDGTYIYATPATSLEAAAIVLHKISVRYPDAEVYYLNISQRVDGTDELIRSFNAELKQVVEHFDAHIVDIYGSAITMADFDTYIGDGRVHPNCLGMDAYTEAFKRALLENTAYPVKTHKVSLKLDGVTADYGDDKIVVSGSDYTVNLATAAEMGLDVTVTMGSRDVTAAVYANGRVTIDSVTDEVTITAKSVYEPKDYRWEFDGVDLVSVCGDNVLTKNAGTTTEDVFHKTRYALERQIFLLHDLPWVVEWKCEGTFLNENGSSGARLFTSDDVNANYNARYIFKSNTNGIVAMGEKTTSGSHNYGVALADYDIDWTAEHTYRLENRIFPDGGNMVYLFVDGKEIGSMNHYYVGTKDQKATSDWLSGKDFVFPYMGTDTHGFTNCSIDYIAVWEGGKSFAGKTISILGDSISTYTGVSNDANANATLAGGAIYYTPGKQGVYQADTWWQQVIDSLDMELCVNNSWSGSAVLPTRSGTAGGYRDRCVQLHNATGEEPDIIAVFLGTNDFSYHQGTLGTADIDYEALITDNADGTFTYASPVTTCEAYAIMLHKMTVRYPDAEIYCMTLLPRRDPDKEDSYADVGQPTEFNAALKEVISHFGCTVVDLENCGIDKAAENFDQYITDQRVHPGPAGMDKITEALISAILGKKTKLYSISGVYTGVQTDNAAAAAAEGMGYTANIAMMAGYSDLRVTITMGGEDITDSAYDNGRIHISAVTGDIVITAAAGKTAADYRWEFSGSSVSSITTDGNKANVLTLLGGSISDGILKNAYFRMAEQVVLYHDRPWAVEWSAAGSWSGMLLSKSQTSSASGNEYFFKSNSTDIGLIAFGQRQNEQYMNYGIKLADHGVDTALRHIYRLENHIADDGSNAVHLLVDGVDYGAMTRHYISTTDQGSDKNWANGRDLTFDYIGANGHMINNCDLDYIQVWEDGEQAESLPLRYDDHYDISGKTVEIVDAGKPTSFQVGYGVAENSVLDTAVVTLEGNKLIATGIGTAKVKIDGETYEVTVEAAPISLLLLAGQSNMRGSEGNANQSIVCPDGMVYSTYGDDRGADNTAMTVNNAAMFAPSALAGEYSTINSVGTTDCLSGYPVHSLTEAGAGKIGPDSGFAYEWAQQTGEKVWVVNAAHGGTSINVWQPGTKEYEECQALFTACTETLRKEIAAGHFTLNHMGYFWCQGCSDRAQSAKWYVDKYLAMHEALKTELAFDHDSDSTTAVKTFEFGGIIPVRVGSTSKCYRDGVNTDSNPYAYHESFVDLRMSGPRVAQYWMGNNPELEDIWTVCTIGDDWVWMPDGTNGVSDYFNKHYANGTVDYQPQVAQSASWYTPTTPKAVHDSVHYNQIGYNEIGRESVRNALIMLGEKEDYAEETTVRFVDWTGYKEVTEITASPTAGSGTLVVPIISPVTRAKSVTFSTSNGLKWNYGDLTADTAGTSGTLSADGLGVSVNVVKAQPGQHYADHLSALPESYCANTDLWKLLEHDSQYYANGTNWDSHSSGQVYSVTIPVSAGDKIFATSFGKSGENGHTSASGIRTTFFNAYGIAKTMTPAETYAEFSANGGYLIAPEGTTAVNVAMWTNGDENELYILSAEHKYVGGICSTCGAQHPALADWSGKVISVMGDSISTFAGYIPVADGFNLEHLPRYPQDDLLTDVNETWWMQVIAALDAKLGINDSWRGATLSGAAPVTTGTTGENAAMSNLIRIQNLGSNGSPDVILLYGGTNDLAHVANIGAFSPDTAPTEADLATTKWDNLADGFLHTILRIRHYYPNAVIIAMLPTFTKSYYSNEKLAQGNAVMAAICEHYGVPYVDLRHCGITTDDLPDGIHPDATGMDFITEAVLAALLEEDVEAGENVVYSVTHTLTGAKTSLGHYKGISAGAAFTETVTGDDLTVTVTMGGADITDTCYADGKITIPAVTGELVITAKGKFSADGHLQPLPERFCAGTNLWTALKHDEEYYTVSGWGIHSSGKVFSVTFPVSGGDQLYGTSFSKAGENGSSTNGIRITYFYENGSVKSLSSAETYAEFASNGYLTVPENAVAVCVPMWTPEDSNELYVLTAEHAYESVVTPPTCTEKGYTTYTCKCGDSYVDSYVDTLGHSYSGTACTVCGAVHPEAGDYAGKVISILSASTSTFAGYIPTADGFNLEHRARYPQDNLLTDVNETWWMQLINELNAKLGINESWAGSQVLNTLDANSGDLGPDACMASLTRIRNLGANGTPDVILFFGAGNDMGRGVTLGSFDPATAPTEVDLTATKWDTLADAYVAAIMRLQYFYPNAEIVVMTTYAMPSYVTSAKLDKYTPVLKAICDHYGVKTVDLRNSGVTFDMLPDKIHPNAEGMDHITEYVLQALLQEVDMEAGEHTVHSVTHNLTNANTSMHYYKGVSHGKAFTETVSGDNVTVTVIMGGVDITATAYADGVISIPAVTGNLVITVKGRFDADGHLQQLPENFCAGTNLWTALEPENIYYTASGWGNTAAGTSWSITFPVKPGDRIWATSLGAYPGNGSTANGVRVTWFDENGVLQSMSRDAVYAEFAKYGYITAPEGAVALNVPMTNNVEGYAVYILSAEHHYDATITAPTCTEQGYTTYSCKVCGDSFVDSYTPTTSHTYGEWMLVTAPACDTEGCGKRTCTMCGVEQTWTLNSEGTFVFTGIGEMNSWADEYSVPWSAYRDQINKVIIGEGITTIGAYAFKLCTNLAEVTIPASVLSIEGRAFYGCSSLASIDFADGLTAIKDKAFKDCTSLTSVALPETMTSLGYGAFSNCSNLRSVEIPTSVTHIQDFVFYSCVKLSEVFFFGDALSLKSSVFLGVTATIYYPCTNSTWNDSNMLNYGGTLSWEAMHVNSTPSAIIPPTCTEKGYTTYTCLCGDSYTDDYVNSTGHNYVSGICATCGVHTPAWDTDGDGVLEIIAIGNSFTVDALTYVYEIAQDLGIEDIVIGQLTIGGSGLSDHAANATGDLPRYRYRCNVNGDLSDTATHDYMISTALEERSWDYIILQQRYYYSGVESSYNEDLTNLVEYLQEYSDAELVWHMTWAIRQDVVDDIYSNNQMTMYNAIVSCVQNKIVSNGNFDRIIPSGTALQNSRTSELGDTDTRDGYHMSYGYGRYLTGLMVIKAITGLSIDGITYAPSSLDERQVAIAIESVNNAYTTPLAVTASKYGHSHTYASVVTAPTCTEQGYTTHTCTVCGDSYVDSYVDALGHSYEATVTYPVGLTKGYTDYTCTSCAEAYRTAWLDPSAYEGKAIACIGDSVTAAYGVTKDQTDYVYLLAKQLGMDYIRLGDSGTTLCTDGSRTCNIRRLTENNLQGADIVTIAMGINDFCAAAEGYYELGDINSTDTSTIYGAARMWCERIAELRKTDSLSHTQFYFVTPVITSWNNSVTSARDWDQSKENIHGYTLRDLCNAIIEVAALYDVPVIDLNLISGLYYNSADDNNIDVFGGDGVHPGVNGHAMMAAALANALLQNDLRDDHTHTYGSWITTKYPGCEEGEEKHVCSICTATESRALDATGHSYHSVVTDPTCTEQGYTTYTCHCGDSYVADYVDATGHSYGEWYEVDAPACTTAGEDRRDCDDCDHYETRVVDALGHDLKHHEAKEPTCIAVGWKAYETCSRCDYTTYAELAATGHDHKAAVTVPTCTEQGYTTYTCHCGDSYVADYVDATGHSYGEWYEVDAPACTTAGEDRRDCDDCDHYETRVVDALGHDLKQHEAKEPTCTAVGWKAYETCSRCDYTTYVELAATGHDHKASVTAPNCTEQGYTTYTCHCGDSYVADYVDATGHSYGEWYEVDAPACTTAGEDRRDCDDCDHYETRVVDALGHNLKQHEAKEPTCTAVGWKAYETCSRCDYSTYEEIPATGHNHAAEVTPPTCTEQGYTTYTCHCGDSYVDSYVDALGHDYEAVITEPTYTEAGYTTYTCTVCGSSYVGDHTDPLPYLKGDLDGNEVTNTDDAIYLLYHAFFGEELYPVNQPCDFDANGSVNTDDAIYLLYHAFFGEQLYPLH